MFLDIGAASAPASQAAVPPVCSTLTGAELPQAKKKELHPPMKITSIRSNSLQPHGLWPTRPLCQRGSPGKNTGAYWPILVATPFYSTIFPAALALRTWCCRAPVTQAVTPPPHLALMGQTQVPQCSLRNKSQWMTHTQRWKRKLQLKHRGSVAKEDDPKSSHQLYSCRLNPHDQVGRLSLWNI